MKMLKEVIRIVPDYPKPGIQFYDITSLLRIPEAFNLALDIMQEYVSSKDANKLIGIESRGFIFASALADRLNLGFIPVRKPGKLPADTIQEDYNLEYGSNTLEIHRDAITKDDRVVVIDDLIATGGTLRATCNLVERLNGVVVGISALIALTELPFLERLGDYDIHYVLDY